MGCLRSGGVSNPVDKGWGFETSIDTILKMLANLVGKDVDSLS